jgi:acyl dehydratase
VPLSYHTDKEAAKNSIYGGVIASGWHTAALMMRLYTENYLSQVANLGSPGGGAGRHACTAQLGRCMRIGTKIARSHACDTFTASKFFTHP